VLYPVLAIIVILMLAVSSCTPQATEPAASQATEAPTEEAVMTEAPAVEEEEAPNTDWVVSENFSPEVAVPEEQITVSFASWVGGGEAYQILAQKFNELYPNITIEFQDVPFEELRTKLLTQVAANNPPDVAYMSSGDVGAFAQRSALVDLGPYMELSNAVAREDYVEPFLNATLVDGKVYGLPITAETTGLFYRTDLFEAAGLDPNAPPKTWDEFLSYAEKLTDPDKKQYGTIVFAPEAAYYWYPWLWQAGGDLISDDGTDILWDSEAGQKAAEYYVGLKDYSPPDFLNSNSWDGRVAFANGTVAMYVAGGWFAGTLLSEFPDITGKWATAPLPEDEQCATTIAGDALVIFQGSKNHDAAWKWIEFLSAPEHMRMINLGTPEAPTTLLPPRTSLLNDPATYEANPVMRGFADAMGCAVEFTTTQERWGEMETFLNEALGAAFYGEMSATDAVIQSAQEAEALVE
jgi:ABC-type glycerol-3-phosphate transport system substrate-binding protein